MSFPWIIITALSSLMTAVLAFLTWKHTRSGTRPKVRVAMSVATFNSTSREVHVEVLLLNNGADAVIPAWRLVAVSGELHIPISDGKLEPARLVHAYAHIEGKRCIIPHRTPTVLSLTKRLNYNLAPGAQIDVEVEYSQDTHKHYVAVCTVPVGIIASL